jgi:SlyX protein
METRLTDIEVKLGFTEDLLEVLNHTIYRQQQQIDQLQQELRALRLKVSAIGADPQNARDEIPPHY